MEGKRGLVIAVISAEMETKFSLNFLIFPTIEVLLSCFNQQHTKEIKSHLQKRFCLNLLK